MRSLLERGQIWTNDTTYNKCRFKIREFVLGTAYALFTDANGYCSGGSTGFAAVDSNNFTTSDIESLGWYQIFLTPEEEAAEKERQKQAQEREQDRIKREAHAEKYL